MIGGRRSNATIAPLASPAASPMASGAARPSAGWLVAISAITAPATLATGPSDKSMPRASTTKNWPRAISARGMALTQSDRRSKAVKPCFRPTRTANRAAKTSTGQLSPRKARLAGDAGIAGSVPGLQDRGVHDAVDGDVGARQLGIDPALEHDDDAVDDAHELARIRRIPDDADALAGKIGDQAVDIALGAEIATPRDVVEKEDLRLRQEPPFEKHLLLIAAAEVADRLLGAAGPDLPPGPPP